MRKSVPSLLSTHFRTLINLATLIGNLLMVALAAAILFQLHQETLSRAGQAARALTQSLSHSINTRLDRLDLELALIDRELDPAHPALSPATLALLPQGSQLWLSREQGTQTQGLTPLAGPLPEQAISIETHAKNARQESIGKGFFVGTTHAGTTHQAGAGQSPAALLIARRSHAGDSFLVLQIPSGELLTPPNDTRLPAGLAFELRDADQHLLVASGKTGARDAFFSLDLAREKYPIQINVLADRSILLADWRNTAVATAFGLLIFILVSLLVSRLLLRLWTRQANSVDTLAASKRALHESERRWRKIFEHAPIGAAIIAPDYRLLNVNEALCRLLDRHRENLLTSDFRDSLHPDERRQEEARMQTLQEGSTDHYSSESRCQTRDGRALWVRISTSLVRDERGQPLYYLSMIEDIDLRKTAEEQINYLAFHDALTGLPNRQLAKDRLDHAIAYAAREKSGVALLHLDLDHFKAINDSLGHSIGDELLKEMATKLDDCIRDTDTLCRLGGDEFLIILANVIDPEIISSIAVKVQETLGATFRIQGHELTTSVSIGITVYPDDGRDFDILLKKADTALYKAKENGRNAYQFYTEQMNNEAVEYLKIRNGLRQALIHDEFLLHYQPQINLADGKVVGVEALIRWRHPELGVLQPSRFITIAEDSGLIVPIGDWALRQACKQAVEWRRIGLPPIIVAVNLSAVQFKRGDIEKSVLQALHESGHDPNYLELELTESILIQDTSRAMDTLTRLKEMGMKLSIDDFGTGYSSLSYLKRLNVDKLKIDQSFVRDMVNNKNDAAIVQAIIQMARSLGLQVIAEGVEDEQLVSMLFHQQCHEAQGYHFARPMAPGAFVDYMANIAADEQTLH